MRILFLVNNLTIGGAETQVVELSRIYKSLGHDVCIGYFSGANAFHEVLERENIANHRIQPRPDFYQPWKFVYASRKVTELCLGFNPHVVHSNLELADVVGQQITLPNKLPHVITFHNLHWWNVRHLPSRWRIAYRKWWLRKGDPIFVAISNAVALRAAGELHLSDSQMHIVNNGIRLENYHSTKWFRGETPKEWVILSVGRFSKEKGQDILIRAIACSNLQNIKFKLILVGGGKMRPELEKLVIDLDLSDKVRFLGERNDIPHLLSKADIYIQPSRSEGMGIALVEALASGLPVVIADIPGMKEVINKVPGLGKLVPSQDPKALANAIEEYIKSPDLCRRQARLGKKSSENYRIESTSAALLELYYQVLG